MRSSPIEQIRAVQRKIDALDAEIAFRIATINRLRSEVQELQGQRPYLENQIRLIRFEHGIPVPVAETPVAGRPTDAPAG